MGIIFGYLSVVCFLLLAAKWITRKCNLKKMDQRLAKIHKWIARLLVVFCVLHLVCVIPVLQNRNIWVNISGIGTVALVAALLFFCPVKSRRKGRRLHGILTALMAVCLSSHMVVYFIDFGEYQRKIADIRCTNPALSEIEDGIYEGEYDAGYIYARVEVQVEGGRIVSIQLKEHRNERGAAAEKILDDIVAAQKIEVDAVSGATNSSKVIKKAVENALCK